MTSFLFAINERWDSINLYRSVISKLYPIFLDFDFDLTNPLKFLIFPHIIYVVFYLCLSVCMSKLTHDPRGRFASNFDGRNRQNHGIIIS